MKQICRGLIGPQRIRERQFLRINVSVIIILIIRILIDTICLDYMVSNNINESFYQSDVYNFLIKG